MKFPKKYCTVCGELLDQHEVNYSKTEVTSFGVKFHPYPEYDSNTGRKNIFVEYTCKNGVVVKPFFGESYRTHNNWIEKVGSKNNKKQK